MTKKKLHPNVVKFKEFVNQHPKIIQEVRNGKVSWQDLYDEWYLLGEEDSRWDPYREKKVESKTAEKAEESKVDWMANILEYVKTMDVNQIQQHIQNVSQAVGAVQGVLSQFKGNSQTENRTSTGQPPQNPFSFRKD